MNVPALLAAIAVGGVAVAVAARPVSAFARQYVSELEQAEAEAAASSEGDDEKSASFQEAEPTDAGSSPDDTSFEPAVIRARWLLTPVAQAVLATVLCGLTLTWGAINDAWGEVIVALPTVALLGAACSVDAVCHRLPNRILGPTALWTGTATLALLAVDVATGTPLSAAAWIALRVALCAVCAGVIVGAMVLIPGSGMGLGDAKLCAVLGLWLGYFGGVETAMGIILGFFIGGVIAIVLMISRLVGRKTLIAFGPYLAVGGWLTWMLAVA
ncbi:A24 family peptidase [Actinomyces viscosus]|uniref:A24 family peptidase n=1 Tax=Actinomyces viscosus TaxID=1656 RepID=UPI0028E1C03D|nr:A24 family peptidase [Actinomyces viscosus]